MVIFVPWLAENNVFWTENEVLLVIQKILEGVILGLVLLMASDGQKVGADEAVAVAWVKHHELRPLGLAVLVELLGDPEDDEEVVHPREAADPAVEAEGVPDLDTELRDAVTAGGGAPPGHHAGLHTVPEADQ